jgi:hypothetical protein
MGLPWHPQNVKVPVGNLLGEENNGFKCIMDNFNHGMYLPNGPLSAPHAAPLHPLCSPC